MNTVNILITKSSSEDAAQCLRFLINYSFFPRAFYCSGVIFFLTKLEEHLRKGNSLNELTLALSLSRASRSGLCLNQSGKQVLSRAVDVAKQIKSELLA